MMKLPDKVIKFFERQSFAIVSTIDEAGMPHNSCKGLVYMSAEGSVHLLDLYRKKTLANITRNPNISITAVDEHKFIGYCLSGRAHIIDKKDITPQIIDAWDSRIASRITKRLLKNSLGDKGHPNHPEAQLPKPEYIITMEVENITDLTPHPLEHDHSL